jgi:hypothetical protein
MRLFEDDMTQVRRAELTPDTEREKIAAPNHTPSEQQTKAAMLLRKCTHRFDGEA